MCGDSFSSFLQSDFDGDKQVRVLSVAFRNSQKSAAPPKSGKKKSKSSGSRRGNVGPFRGRPRDSYPEEDDYFEHSHPAPREFLFAWFFVKVSTSVAWSWCFLVFSTALLWRREVVSWMMASPECLDLKSAVGSGVFLPAWEKIIYDAFYTFGSRGRVLLRFCGTSSIWRPPEPLSDHVPLSGSLFGRNSVPAGEGGDRRNSRSPPSLFFAGVCGTQVFGLFENDSLEVNQSLFGQVPFSDGSSINLPSFFESGRRRSLPGSSRRLLSFPIHPRSRDRLGLSFGTSFTGSRLFPLGCAPLLGFHEKFSMVMAHLRRQGLRLFAFLDGCLLVAKSEVLLLDLSRVLFSTTQDL